MRAQALAADNEYSLARDAAAAYYDCYQHLSDPFARDAAHLEYLYLLSNSAPDSDEGRLVEVLQLVGDSANSLAASTVFPDIKKRALWLRNNVRTELKHLTQP
jgi:hypothetical protein